MTTGILKEVVLCLLRDIYAKEAALLELWLYGLFYIGHYCLESGSVSYFQQDYSCRFTGLFQYHLTTQNVNQSSTVALFIKGIKGNIKGDNVIELLTSQQQGASIFFYQNIKFGNQNILCILELNVFEMVLLFRESSFEIIQCYLKTHGRKSKSTL